MIKTKKMIAFMLSLALVFTSVSKQKVEAAFVLAPAIGGTVIATSELIK